MSNFEWIEFAGVAFILFFQGAIFTITVIKTFRFGNIFPADISKFKITVYKFNKHYLSKHPKEILSNLKKYEEASRPKLIEFALKDEAGNILKPAKYEDDNRLSVDLLSNEGGNEITTKIVTSFNTYLIRNRGMASDFHLLKDIVERNCDIVGQEIQQIISVPLYLGLLGTFFGIIFGLFQISGFDFSANTMVLDSAIALLLGGVKIAMVASFFGLLLTVVSSSIFLRSARTSLEEKKNEFYTFIQTDLLPLLNQNINSTLHSLQANLHTFNDEFKINLNMLNGVMGRNRDALITQEKILNKLVDLDIVAFADANVKILKELEISMAKLIEFSKYLNVMNEMTASANSVTSKLDEMIERTDTLGSLAEKVVSTFDGNLELQRFLQDHYSSLDDSRQLIAQSVGKVGEIIDESLEQLKTFTQERINEVQQITLREIDLMQNQYPEKWKKLDNLIYLEALNKNIGDIKISSASQIGSLNQEVKALNEKLNKAIYELEGIKKNSNNVISTRISESIQKLFGIKNGKN